MPATPVFYLTKVNEVRCHDKEEWNGTQLLQLRLGLALVALDSLSGVGVVLRGAIGIRTHHLDENLNIPVILLGIFGPDRYVPPQ